MAFGLLDAFMHAEENGKGVLSFGELLFMADAKKKKGCKCQENELSDEDIKRVLELGKKCRDAGRKQ